MSCEAGCICTVFRSTLFGKDKCKTCSHAKTSHSEFRSDSSFEREQLKPDAGVKADDDSKKEPFTPRGGTRQKPVKNPHKRVHSIPKPLFSTHRRATSEPAISLLDGEIVAKGPQISGYLEKIASHTFAGKEVWQRRWFVLDKDLGTLQYWHQPSDVLLENSKMTLLMDRVVSTEFDGTDKRNRTLLLCFADDKLQPFYVRSKTAGGCAHWKREFDTTARAALSGLTEEEACDIEVSHFENTAFSILSLAQLRTLSALFKLVLYKQHNPIFSPEIDGPHFALILSGKVALMREGAEEDTHRTLKEGDYLSRSTFDPSLQRRIATAKSVVWETHCWQLSTENYQRYLTIEKDESVKKIVSMLIGEDYNFLGKVDVLSCMPRTDHPFLAAFFRYQFLGAGETLFEEGSVGTALYIVLTGCVQACGQGSVMREFREHEFFGEVGLLMAIPRTASMVAGEDSVIIRLDKPDFTQATALLTPEAREALDSLARLRLAEQFTKYDVPLFQMIPQAKYQELADICHMQDFPRGAIIFREDDPGATFFLLVHGRCAVSVRKKMPDGSVVDEKIAEKKPGEYFGEIAMIVETTRTATVSCLERSVVLSITAEDFSLFFREAPEALADFELKLARHQVRLCSILYHPIGSEYLAQFLKAEYSQENYDFWKACLAFTRMPEHTSVARRKAEERRLSRSFFSRISRSPKHGDGERKEPRSSYLDPRVSSMEPRSSAMDRPSAVALLDRPSVDPHSLLDRSSTEPRSSAHPSSVGDRPSTLESDPSRPSSLLPASQEPRLSTNTADPRPSTTDPRPSTIEPRPSSGSPERKIPPPPPPLPSPPLSPTIDGVKMENKTETKAPPPPPLSSGMAEMQLSPRKDPKGPLSPLGSPLRKNDGLEEDRISLLIELPTPPPPPELKIAVSYPDEIKIHERCQAIYDEFLDPNGEHQVNLSLVMREVVRKALLEKRVDINTLAQCFAEVETLVQTDSFSRFKKSPLFEELLEQVQSYDSKSQIRGRMKPTKSATSRVPADGSEPTTPKVQQPGTHRRMRSLTTKASNMDLGGLLDDK